jgi:hypothetical protein
MLSFFAAVSEQTALDQERLALITMVGVVITGVLSLIGVVYSSHAKKQATQANDAVNHRESGQPKLIEVADTMARAVVRIEERLDHSVERLDSRDRMLERKLNHLGTQLDQYIRWDQQRRWATVDQVASEVVRQTEWDGTERRVSSDIPYFGTERRRPSQELPTTPEEGPNE